MSDHRPILHMIHPVPCEVDLAKRVVELEDEIDVLKADRRAALVALYEVQHTTNLVTATIARLEHEPRLTDEQRAAILARIREDRSSGKGVEFSAERVARDVVASSRLAGIAAHVDYCNGCGTVTACTDAYQECLTCGVRLHGASPPKTEGTSTAERSEKP